MFIVKPGLVFYLLDRQMLVYWLLCLYFLIHLGLNPGLLTPSTLFNLNSNEWSYPTFVNPGLVIFDEFSNEV